MLKRLGIWRLVVAIVVLDLARSATAAAAAGEKCISQGPRFPRFALEGQPPRRAPDSLRLCRIFRGRTCCNAVQATRALAALRYLATSGEGSKECLDLWEVLECSICDPRVGTVAGPPTLCRELCESVFKACSEAYFSTDSVKQILAPCTSETILCAKAKLWTTNSTRFCELVGFRVANSVDFSSQSSCFDGRPDTESASSRPSKGSEKSLKLAWRQMLRRFVKSLEADHVSWALAGLVLGAAALLSRRRMRAKQRRAAMLRAISQRQQAVSKTSVR